MKAWKVILIIVLISLPVATRLLMLTHQSLWYDEGVSLHYSGGKTVAETWERIVTTSSSERFQPLYFLILHLWRALAGDSEFVLRLLSVIFGSSAVIVLYNWIAQVYDVKAARVLALFLSVSAYAVTYSQEVRPYSLMLLLASLQLVLLNRVISSNGTSRSLIYAVLLGIGSGVAFFSSIFAGLLTLSLAVSHLIVSRDFRFWWRSWTPAVLCSFPALAFYLSSSVFVEGISGYPTLLRQPLVFNMLFCIYGLMVGQTFGPAMESLRDVNKLQTVLQFWPLLGLLLIAAIILCAAVYKVLLAEKRSRTEGFHFSIFFFIASVLCFAGLLFFGWITSFSLQPRHCIVLLPLVVALLVRSVIPADGDRNYRRLLLGARVSFAALLLMNGYSLYHYYYCDAYQRDDYRSAGLFISAHAPTPSVLLWGMPNLLHYYGATNVIDGGSLSTVTLPHDVDSVSNHSRSVFLVLNRQFYWSGGSDMSQHVGSSYSIDSLVTFQYFKIYGLTKK